MVLSLLTYTINRNNATNSLNKKIPVVYNNSQEYTGFLLDDISGIDVLSSLIESVL